MRSAMAEPIGCGRPAGHSRRTGRPSRRNVKKGWRRGGDRHRDSAAGRPLREGDPLHGNSSHASWARANPCHSIRNWRKCGKLRADDPASKDRWIAKRRVTEVERRVSQALFREFVTSTLNKPAASAGSLRSSRSEEEAVTTSFVTGKRCSCGEDGELGSQQAGRRCVYPVWTIPPTARHNLASPAILHCQEGDISRCGACAPSNKAELKRQVSRFQSKKALGPDGVTR